MGSKDSRREITRYRMTVHFAVCHSVDELRGIYIGEKEAWAGALTEYEQVTVIEPQFFGGSKLEGGIEGVITYYPGDASQQLITKHAGKLGLTPSTAPAYRGLCTVWFEELPPELNDYAGFYWIGNNPYMKPVWFKVARAPVGLDAAYAKVPRGASTAPYRTEYVYLDATTNAGTNGLSVGVEFSGFSAEDVVKVRIQSDIPWPGIASLVSAWKYGDPANAYTNRFDVIRDGDSGDRLTINSSGVYANGGLSYSEQGFTSAADAFDAYTVQQFTGGSSYTFFIYDTPTVDNVGGLPLRIDAYANEWDANPAHIIYESLTNAEWGGGIAAASVDIDAFEAAAVTLYAEDFGLSMVWMQQASIEDFIREILDHIDAVLYVSPLTGKITLKLIRDDYDEGTLDTLTPDNSNITSWQRKATGELVNEVIVTWTDPRNEEEQSVIVQSFGDIAAQGTVISDTRNYYGVRKRSLAFKLAQRDLRASSMPLASCEIDVDRSAWAYVPGDVVKVQTPEDGISSITMRVVGVDYGQPGNSTIRLSLVEDVFGKEIQEYDEPDDTSWTDPVPDPTDMTYVQIISLPYLIATQQVSASVVNDAEYPDTIAGVLAAHTSTSITQFDLWTGPTTYTLVDTLSTVTRGTLPDALIPEVTSAIYTIDNATTGIGLAEGALLFIGPDGGDGDDMELAYVQSSGSPATVLRGVLDTVPKEWPAGTPVWIVRDQSIVDPTIRAEGEVAYFKLLTRTGRGVLSLTAATEHTATLSARALAPFRPANVKVNGNDGFAGTVDITADSPPDLVVTFNTRNRLTEDTTILDWGDASVAVEAGQTAVIELRRATDDALLETYSSVTSPYTVPSVDYSGQNLVKVKVFAERDGIRSIQAYEITVQVGTVNDGLDLETGDSVLIETTGDRLELE